MPVDINGYALSNSSGLAFGASGTKIIAANYGIRDPMLPAMLGSATGGGTYKCYPFPVNDVNLNIGSCWSTGTYAFTCPVTGILLHFVFRHRWYWHKRLLRSDHQWR